jgi:hypothetical protein
MENAWLSPAAIWFSSQMSTTLNASRILLVRMSLADDDRARNDKTAVKSDAASGYAWPRPANIPS